MPRQRKRQRRSAAGFVIVAVVVLGVPLLGWAGVNALTGGDTGDDSPATADDARADAAAETSRGDETPGSFEIAQAARDAVSACADRLAAGDAYVERAGVGIGHWGEHVQARTDMLNGTVAEDDMRAIWKRTRLAGPDDVAQATAALEAYEALPGCADLASIEDAPENVAEQAAACLERETAMTAAVAASTTGLQDWANHLNAMAAHADGEMTAAAAQDLWVAAWEAAPVNIGAFDDARAVLAAAPACE
ncbi:hypothetical protein E1262_23895 [Jiangella aurantiaca]|uniref:Uncharacterized protein n=1 Tax=Jiangella aurantiaca TaxID=2530373 RepID=A0A4R5A570_9ACTN|nr:hypothetical protein [Jiangella aurantiaca]TDD65859.1 hypothetical protein E1262_23895 [Jiangella aurantiaca]